MNAVELSGVDKVFPGPVQALDGIELTMGDGEFVSLIGPSGCGKSTLLRVVADLERPTSGTVHVGGKPAAQARTDQDYGIAFQQAGLLEWRTVAENVERPLHVPDDVEDVRGSAPFFAAITEVREALRNGHDQ